MMVKISDNITEFNSFLTKLKHELCQIVALRIEQQLETDIDKWLYRSHHQRREGVGRRKTSAKCCHCGSQQATHFCRNGHRERQVVTTYGVISFWLPRVVCQCGGSVKIPFSILEPYQRLWDDVTEQINRWASLGLSLRQMQNEIGHQMGTQIGLRKLNETVQNIAMNTAIELTSVPPVIMLDAIWVTLLRDTDAVQKDKKGRNRVKKERNKVCILVALGIYPQSQRCGILGWVLADNEDQVAWERLLVPLENRGLYRERGLELFIHDGGKGLIATLNFMYPRIPHQRCIFHKLRNLWQAIQTPEGMSREDKKAFKRELIKQVAEVFYASTAEEALQLRDVFCEQWQNTQPKMVETLKRDWQDSMAFHRILAKFPRWPRRTLRTTSLLERVNQILRRLFRAAGAYQSTSGLVATVACVLTPMRLI